MKRLVILSFLILPITYAMIINVEIEDIISGRSAYHNFSNASIISFNLDWENIGSIDCKVRLRMDILDLNSSNLYVSWSKEEILAPGSGTLLSAYYLPKKSGNYSATIKLYYCNDIYTISSFNFSFTKQEFKELNLSLNIATTRNQIKFKIKPKRNIDNLYIIPENYPRGWIFESLKLENLKKGEEKEIVLNYIPAFWISREINFTLVSEKYAKTIKIKLEKEKKYPISEIIILFLLISLSLNFYFILRRETKKN